MSTELTDLTAQPPVDVLEEFENRYGNGTGGGKNSGQPRRSYKAVRDAMTKAGGRLSIAAKALNVRRETMYQYMDRWPDLKQVRQDADELVSDFAEHTVIERVMAKDPSMATWWLKHKARQRGYGDTVEVQHGGGIETRTIIEFEFIVPEKRDDDSA